MSMIYIYCALGNTVNKVLKYEYSFVDVGEVADINPWNYEDFKDMTECAFKLAVSSRMKEFSFTIMEDVEFIEGGDYDYVDFATELKIRVYNELIKLDAKIGDISVDLKSVVDESFTVSRIRNLLDPTMPLDVEALQAIISRYEMPIEIVNSPSVKIK